MKKTDIEKRAKSQNLELAQSEGSWHLVHDTSQQSIVIREESLSSVTSDDLNYYIEQVLVKADKAFPKLTKKDLIKALEGYPDDWPVTAFSESMGCGHLNSIRTVCANGTTIQLNADH